MSEINLFSKLEMYLAKKAGHENIVLPTPTTRIDFYLAKWCGEDVTLPEEVLSRNEDYLLHIINEDLDILEPIYPIEYYWKKIAGIDTPLPDPMSREEELLLEIIANLYDLAESTDTFATRITAEGIQLLDGANAELKKVKGKTVKFNQLINPANYPASSTSNNVTFTPNADGTITVTVGEGGASATTYYQLKSGIFSKTTDKFLLKGGANNGSNSTYRIAFDLYNNTSWVVGVSDYGNGAFLNTTADFNTLSVNIVIYKNCPFGTYIFKPQLFDLTVMYGAGNEPSTVAAFTVDHPKDIYSYDAGSLKNAHFAGLKEYDTNGSLQDILTFDDIELKGVGTAQDEINLDTGKKITRCATVDLGSLTWTIEEDYGYSYIRGRKLTSSLIYNLLPTGVKWIRLNTDKFGVVAKFDGTITFTSSSLKTAMSGVMATYELATPIEEDISITNDQIRAYNQGTEEIINSNNEYGALVETTIIYVQKRSGD